MARHIPLTFVIGVMLTTPMAYAQALGGSTFIIRPTVPGSVVVQEPITAPVVVQQRPGAPALAASAVIQQRVAARVIVQERITEPVVLRERVAPTVLVQERVAPPVFFEQRVAAPVVLARVRVVALDREAREKSPARVEPRLFSAPAPVRSPAPSKTVYVIPGCYAGDKPPDVSTLREGCDIRDMKVIPAA
jgi:hypothetical protein